MLKAELGSDFENLSNYVNRKMEVERAEHKEKVRALGDVIFKQASACISHSRSYVTVWEYARVTGKDFNSAARELLGDKAERQKEGLSEARWNISKILEDLKNSPLEHADSLHKLVDLYDLYLEIHSLALNPSGAMESYNDSINELQDGLSEVKDELDALLGK